MPWTAADATKHTKKAATPKAKQAFAKVANKVLKKSGDEGKAVRVANATVAKIGGKPAAKKKPAEKPALLSKARFS